MKIIIFTLALFCIQCVANAQNLIAVEHNGASTFYTTLDSAVNAAQTGDNVYIPGGNFTLSVPISKGYNLIGVGYNPDSTIATGFTQITSSSSGNIYIITGADNGSITGINFYPSVIQFGNSANQEVHNFQFARCKFWFVTLGSNSSNIVFTENDIEGAINGSNVTNCLFSKNIFGPYYLSNFQQGNEFINNIFLAGYSSFFNYVNNSDFKNNIFLNSGISYSNSANNTFYNNLFVIVPSIPGMEINSLHNVVQSSIFVNQTGNTYDYHQNYHLKSSCPGHNYGTDGTDLGVYGTATPWKEGGMPYNPHIQFQSIATQTDGNGNLSINIKVAAQKN